jgi:hypothetical protein
MIQSLGIIGAVLMPLWNIPLILKIQQRRSSKDISLAWVLGVWACMMIMLPSGLVSADRPYRLFTICNASLFSAVVVQVLRFRRGE